VDKNETYVFVQHISFLTFSGLEITEDEVQYALIHEELPTDKFKTVRILPTLPYIKFFPGFRRVENVLFILFGPSSAEIKNERGYTYIPPICLPSWQTRSLYPIIKKIHAVATFVYTYKQDIIHTQQEYLWYVFSFYALYLYVFILNLIFLV